MNIWLVAKLSLVVCLVLALGACGEGGQVASQVIPESGEQAAGDEVYTAQEKLSQRILLRWKAIAEDDFRLAHGFISPGIRSTIPVSHYVKKMRSAVIDWRDAEISSLTCPAEYSCKASLIVRSLYQGVLPAMRGAESEHKLEERWVLVGQQWYYVP